MTTMDEAQVGPAERADSGGVTPQGVELRHQRHASVRLHRADRAEGMTQQPLPARPAAALTEGGGR